MDISNTSSLSDRLQNCYTGAVFDVLRNMGYPNQVLPAEIRPVNLHHKIAGRAYTIEGQIDKTIDKHTSLLKWCEMLSSAPSDYVMICQPNDKTVAHMGELSSETLTYKKVRGYIVDGGCRDSAFIEKIGFPVFCKYFTPRDVVATWAVTALGQPIEIGGVKIETGDYVLADRDGVVIVPQSLIEQVVIATEDVLQTENLVRKAMLQGVDPVDAYLKYGKF
jgi:regulator of RNase E activity RraA